MATAVARAPTKAVAPMRRALSGSRAAAAAAAALDANDADAQRRLRFAVTHPTRGDRLLAAPDAAERARWLDAINAAAAAR